MDKKIINNAISAYFGLWALLLLPSKKEKINNHFVKKHSKTAVFIHFLMLLNYIIFVWFKLFWSISLFWFYLNHVLASTSFLLLFWWLLYWVYKASLWEDFWIKDIASKTNTNNFIEIKNSSLNEQWVFTIILSLVPFLWLTLRGKFFNYKSPIIENNIKLNFISTFFISLFFIFWYENIWFLLWLIYLIFLWFYAILIIVKSSVISFKLEKILTFREMYIYTLSFISYVKNYFKANSFIEFKIILQEKINMLDQLDKQNKIYLSSLKDPKIKNTISYIPVLNLISIYDLNSKNKNHIKNGFIITILFIILISLKLQAYLILLLFIIFFSVWYVWKIEYRIYFLYDFYQFFEKIFLKIFWFWGKVKDLKQTKNEVSFEIEGK